MDRKPNPRLLLIRHGETEWSREGRFCGRSDPPLNQLGVRQAESLADRLRGEKLTAIYASPARRACQTAERLQRPFSEHSALWEQDFGAWEGRRPAEVARETPDVWVAWQSGLAATPPGGESLEAVAVRARSWLHKIVHLHGTGTIAAVAHGGVLQAVLCELLGTPLRPLWPYRLCTGGMAEVWIYPAGAVLVSLRPSSDLP